MFIIKFHGGLGNQMFEYIFMQRMRKEYPDSVVKAFIPKIRLFNGYELKSIFNIEVDEASLMQAARLADRYPDDTKKIRCFLEKARGRLFGLKSTTLHQDDYTAFYKEVFQLNPLRSYYLLGVWANARYLEGMDDVIEKSFVFRDGLSDENQRYIDQMQRENSVSIHVRRNDYVTLGVDMVSDRYYFNAIDFIMEHVQDPVFYVFSDDYEYCRCLFGKYIRFTIIEGNSGKDSFRDMQLMSKCKHNIIANSTFSFWGAYLNTDADKIVIAPNISFGGDCRHPFACEDWIKMDV